MNISLNSVTRNSGDISQSMQHGRSLSFGSRESFLYTMKRELSNTFASGVVSESAIVAQLRRAREILTLFGIGSTTPTSSVAFFKSSSGVPQILLLQSDCALRHKVVRCFNVRAYELQYFT